MECYRFRGGMNECTIGEGRRQFGVENFLPQTSIELKCSIPAQLEVHDLHLKKMRGEKSVKHKALSFNHN